MNLISFVKLLPKGKKVQIAVNNDLMDLDIKTLAEHQLDTVTGIDYMDVDEYFVIAVSTPVTTSNVFLNACNCHA